MWTTALLVIVPTALFVGLVVVLHHYFAPEGGWLRSMEDAGEIFSTVGTGLAVLIAFLIVAAFGHYQSARDAVGKEAVAVQQQYVMATYFDEADSDALRGEVHLLRAGRRLRRVAGHAARGESAGCRAGSTRMDDSMREAPVGDQKQVEALAHWFDVSNDRQEARRARLAESKPFVPGLPVGGADPDLDRRARLPAADDRPVACAWSGRPTAWPRWRSRSSPRSPSCTWSTAPSTTAAPPSPTPGCPPRSA